jgi:3'(2'), 5'-bisphosphate nucleotidase
MQATEIKALAEALLSVALAAARLQMEHFATGVAVETKADRSPVTIADRQSEEIILAGLARVAPGIPVVSEEAAAGGHLPTTGETFFLVDPLDGTKPYIRGSSEFTINIALIRAGQPVFGLVYAPAIPDFYVTVGPAEALAGRVAPSSPARTLTDCGLAPVRTQVPDPNALRAFTSQSHINSATARFLDHYSIIEQRAVSSSLKFGLMARGEADIYPRIGETSEWDTAAGHAVLAAAGGTVTTLDGQPLLYGKPRFRNPDFVAWGRMPMAKLR